MVQFGDTVQVSLCLLFNEDNFDFMDNQVIMHYFVHSTGFCGANGIMSMHGSIILLGLVAYSLNVFVSP